MNMPRELLPWEAELRSLVQAQVGRGKVDVNINRSGGSDAQPAVELNLPLAKAYVAALRELQHTLKLKNEIDLAPLLNRSDLLRVSERRGDAAGDIAAVKSAVAKALQAFNRDREREGKALGKDMLQRARRLQQLQSQIAARVKVLVPELAARLRQRTQDLLAG